MNTSLDYSNNRPSYLIDSTMRIEIHLSIKRATIRKTNSTLQASRVGSDTEYPYRRWLNNRASTYLVAQNIGINIFKVESEGLRILANGQGSNCEAFIPTKREEDRNPEATEKERRN